MACCTASTIPTPIHIPDLTLLDEKAPTPPPRSPRRKQYVDPLLAPSTHSPTESSLPSPTAQQFPWGLAPIQEDAEGTDESQASTALAAAPVNVAAKVSGMSLGMRVAKSAYAVRAWVEELEGWTWDRTFEAPRREKHSELPGDEVRKDAFWDTFPASQALVYASRGAEISRAMEDLNIEDQKMLVLRRFPPTEPGSMTSKDTAPALSLVQLHELDDLTALTTMTLMQTLPYYTQLVALLATWKARLSILSQLPSFLATLYAAQCALDAAWRTIGLRASTTASKSSHRLRRVPTANLRHLGSLRADYENLRASLEAHIVRLWQQLDGMLDVLEGGEDTLPVKLLAAVVECEHDYAHWAVEAQARLLRYEFRVNAARLSVSAHGVSWDAKIMLADAAAAATAVITPGTGWWMHDVGADDCDADSSAGLYEQSPRSEEQFPLESTPRLTFLIRRKSLPSYMRLERPDSGYGSGPSDCDSNKDEKDEEY